MSLYSWDDTLKKQQEPRKGNEAASLEAPFSPMALIHLHTGYSGEDSYRQSHPASAVTSHPHHGLID